MDNNSMNQETPNYDQQMTYQVEKEEPMSVKEWLITLLILAIPCVNIIMYFVWAFSKSEKKSKSNFFKAGLIWAAVWFCITIILSILMFATGAVAALAY